MAGSTGSALAVAVGQGGGLGSLPCAMLAAEQVRSEVARIRVAGTAPFNLNFFCHAEPADDPVRMRPLAGPTRSVRRRARGVAGRPGSGRPRLVRLGPLRAGRAAATRGGQLPLRAARTRAGGPGARHRGRRHVLGDDRRRGLLAGGTRLRRGHRPGSRGRWAPGDVPDRPAGHPARHHGPGATGARRGDRRRSSRPAASRTRAASRPRSPSARTACRSAPRCCCARRPTPASSTAGPCRRRPTPGRRSPTCSPAGRRGRWSTGRSMSWVRSPRRRRRSRGRRGPSPGSGRRRKGPARRTSPRSGPVRPRRWPVPRRPPSSCSPG